MCLNQPAYILNDYSEYLFLRYYSKTIKVDIL